ncbi:hypothetical protein QBC32DRAFT_325141 [Pseudoneurospora amorphoporcata]|uniref:Uncharacterized protein n=1 Tax=Pseudoneurospora amorphoporcata TaxID=241081 RepID=A0AAN6SFE4_9PEZI|nr:hypothetical protein QBC32DRAFT_325141 [Pseudoneurospora amorphoporcata]
MSDSSKNWPELVSFLQSMQLDLPPSCIELCPSAPSYFLIGTYNLEGYEGPSAAASQNTEAMEVEKQGEEHNDDDTEATVTGEKKGPQNRDGSILAFQLVDDQLVHVQTLMQPSAILDLHFNPAPGKQDICATVSSTATLALFLLTPGNAQPLKHLKTMDMASMCKTAEDWLGGKDEVIFTHFAWHPTKPDMVAVTTTAGYVHLIYLGEDLVGGDWVMHPEPILTHTLEAWYVSISPSLSPPGEEDDDSFLLLSGGDDSALRYTVCKRTRNADAMDDDDESESPYRIEALRPPVNVSRGHDAGVTAILPLGLKDGESELVVTGSYDDHIRLLSIPAYGFGRAVELAGRNLGGGVWRLKVVKEEKGLFDGQGWRLTMLVSCMHAGARVVELLKSGAGEYEFRVIGRFEEHKSMNYGSDGRLSKEGTISVVSTSFYDKLLCLWKLELGA